MVIRESSSHHSGEYFPSFCPHKQTCPLSLLLLLTWNTLSNTRKPFTSRVPLPSLPSFLDITPALQEYLQFIVSFTHHSHPNTKSPFSLHTTITLFFPHYYSFCGIQSHAIKYFFNLILSFHGYSGDQTKCCIY